MTATLVRPSKFLPEGICIQRINNLTLFKFTDKLGERMQELLDKHKLDTLTPDEKIELEAISELDDIFSYINAVIAAQDNAHSSRQRWVESGLHPPGDDPKQSG